MSLATEGKFQLLFSYPEILLENNNKTMLKTAKFQKNVRFNVVDEAHLRNKWWVLLFSWIPFAMSCSEIEPYRIYYFQTML